MQRTALIFSKVNVIRWGYIAVFILFLISFFLGFYANKKLIDQSNLVTHTYKVVNNIDLYISELTEKESTVRGFLITGDENAFEVEKINSKTLDSVYSELRNLTADNQEQQQRLLRIKNLTNDKLHYLESGVSAFKKNNYKLPDSLRTKKTGKLIMDDIKSIAVHIKEDEQSLLTARDEQVNRTSTIISGISLISLLIAVGLIIYSVITYYKENMARREADNKVAEYHNQLELRIQELDKLNKELTELKNIEKFALTGRISRTIAHEVRNPLTNINLAIEQLKSDLPEKDEYSMLLEMVTRNANRINQLITDLLNSTKMNLLTFEHKNINELLDESLEFAQDRIELKGIKVVKNYMDSGCTLNVDPQKIKIAFLNIIVNAIEAMPEGKGVLDISSEASGGKCKVVFADNGSGISTESLSKLFEPYFTTKSNGTGLGLTNTQNIILSHNASIVAESEEGKGTSFTLTFNVS